MKRLLLFALGLIAAPFAYLIGMYTAEYFRPYRRK